MFIYEFYLIMTIIVFVSLNFFYYNVDDNLCSVVTPPQWEEQNLYKSFAAI